MKIELDTIITGVDVKVLVDKRPQLYCYELEFETDGSIPVNGYITIRNDNVEISEGLNCIKKLISDKVTDQNKLMELIGMKIKIDVIQLDSKYKGTGLHASKYEFIKVVK